MTPTPIGAFIFAGLIAAFGQWAMTMFISDFTDLSPRVTFWWPILLVKHLAIGLWEAISK